MFTIIDPAGIRIDAERQKEDVPTKIVGTRIRCGITAVPEGDIPLNPPSKGDFPD